MRSRPLRSLIAESVAVILSILIAFGLDAWWDRQGAQEELRAELVNVVQELTANREEFEARREQHRRAQSSIDRLLGTLDASAGSARVLVADTVLMEAFVFVPTSDPSTGALDVLIASGGLADRSQARSRRTQGLLRRPA